MRPKIIDISEPGIINPIYTPLFYDNNRYKLLYGGRDSAKSDSVAIFNVVDMMEQDYFKLILLRQYYANIYQSQFQTIVDILRRWEIINDFHITTSPLHIVYRPKQQNQIIAKGLDQSDNTKSIKDPTALWMEEMNQIGEAAFVDSDLSLRSSLTQKLSVWGSFNPDQEHHWINRRFFPSKESYEKQDGNFHWVNATKKSTTILHTTYKDNLYCNQERRDNLESLKDVDENYYKVKALGLWGGALKGLVYNNWKLVNKIPAGADICYGLDYGYNNPTAFVKVGFYDNEIYVQQLLYRSNLTHTDVIDLILANWRHEIKGKRIVVDCAAPELISVMKKAGLLAMPSTKGPNSVYDGILTVKRFPLNICDGSEEILREIQSYIWKRTKEDEALDEPIKFFDHAMDAIRYVLYTYGRRFWFQNPNKPQTATRERKPRNTFYNGF